ncbi:MAG: hypothetical protein K6C36_04005 [Clostridia bacterium]|nr:hypothetical protein [Clostridia bacterium]
MKKLISVILAAVMLASAAAPAVSAAADDPTKYPVIIITGYSSSYLEMTKEDGSKETVWKLDFGSLPEMLLSNLAEVALAAGNLALGDPEVLAKVFAEKFLPVVEPLRMNPDGTSVYDVQPVLKTARDMNIARIFEEEDGRYIDEPGKVEAIGEVMGGYEHMYFCYSDFRRSILDCAEVLNNVIEGVLKLEHAKKVNVMAISHGGQELAFYLAKYGSKNRIHNAVLTCPAVGGAAMAWDAFNPVHLDMETLWNFIENANMREEDVTWLKLAYLNGYLDEIIAAVQPYIMEYVGCWGSLWDFIPPDKYEEFRSRFDPVEYAGLIAQADETHRIMATIGEKLRECQAAGTNISVTCGTGAVAVTGYNVNSDGIIPVYCATGATTPEYGLRFSDGYAGCGTVCSDPTHNHVSPSMEVDASSAYLPENTWYIEGMFHAQENNDPYSKALYLKLLLTDDLKDVYSDPAFPQFHQAMSRQYGAAVSFNSSSDGYVSGADDSVIVTNLSKEYPMRLLGLRTTGMDLVFNTLGVGEIAPGQSVSIPFAGKVPEVSRQRAAITVTFSHKGNTTPVYSRTLDLTIMNGPAVEYDPDEPCADADFPSVFSEWLSDASVTELRDSGLLRLFELIYNVFYKVIYAIRKIAGAM